MQSGDAVGNATLFLSNVTLLLNITPETKDGQGIPGVEFSKALYTLGGDIVATADLRKASSWQSVDAEKVGGCVGWDGGTAEGNEACARMSLGSPGEVQHLCQAVSCCKAAGSLAETPARGRLQAFPDLATPQQRQQHCCCVFCPAGCLGLCGAQGRSPCDWRPSPRQAPLHWSQRHDPPGVQTIQGA